MMQLCYLVGFLVMVSALATKEPYVAAAAPVVYRRYSNETAICTGGPECKRQGAATSKPGYGYTVSSTSTPVHYITKSVACPDCKIPETITLPGESGQVVVVSVPTDKIEDTYTSINPSAAPVSSIVVPGQTRASVLEYEGMGAVAVASATMVLISLLANLVL